MLSRRDFLKFMGVSMVMAALPIKIEQGVGETPSTPSQNTWCERCKCFHGPSMSLEEFTETVIKEAAQKLADDIDNKIFNNILAGIPL